MYQKNKPDPIITDHRNTSIVSGAKVAFNRSGDVEFGKIVSFKSEWKKEKANYNHKDTQGRIWWRLHFELEVEREKGGISIVKNHRSFLILN